MKIENIKKRKHAKNFYSGGFRKAINALGLSIVLNFVLLGIIDRQYVNTPVQHFYATDGITMPKLVTPMDKPNMLSQPLLPDDVPEEMTMRQLANGM